MPSNIESKYANDSLDDSFDYFGSQIDFSLAHEISESTAAFLADDDEDWTITSPVQNISDLSIDEFKKTNLSTPLLSSTPEVTGNRLCRKRLPLNDSCFSPIGKRLKHEVDSRLKDYYDWREITLKKQLELIKKKTGTEKFQGVHLLTKEKKELKTLKDALNNKHPVLFTFQELLQKGLKNNVIGVSTYNAVDFIFNVEESYLGCQNERRGVFLGGLLIPSQDFKVGLDEITQCFLSLPGVDPSLVSDKWISNHFRWIVWKLASYEKSFPDSFGNRSLTVKNVLLQLQYRHDREITLAQRPALRKILEQDESPFKMIVLCVANVRKLNLEQQTDGIYELELTDGWYSIWTTTDFEMNRLVQNSKVKIGTKLVIHGAQLVGADQPVDPLQDGAASGIRLKICTNSTRRAVWYCRLGFLHCSEYISSTVRSVLPNGGQVSCLNATVARVYPMLYMSKDSKGKNVFRSSKAESVEANFSDRMRAEKAEELYQQVLAEVESNYKISSGSQRRVTRSSIKNLSEITQPDVLCDMMEQSADPLFFQSQLSLGQVKMLLDYRRQIREKIQSEVREKVKKKLEEVLPERKVTHILKVLLVDECHGDTAMLTMWRPTDDLCSSITENSVFKFKCISANGIRDKTLQLSSTRQMQLKKDSAINSQLFSRKLTPLAEVDLPTFRPTFGEFDTVGFAIEIQSTPSGVNLVYVSDVDMNLLAITFWTSIKMFCKEEVFNEGLLVSACNVQWRYGSVSWQVPKCYATALSTFSNHASQPHLKSIYNEYKNKFRSKCEVKCLVEKCKTKLAGLLTKRDRLGQSPSTSNTPCNTRNTPVTSKSYLNSPVSSVANIPANTDRDTSLSIDNTPVLKRLKKLSAYSSPPPLMALPISIATPHHSVMKDYKSPLRLNEIATQNSQASVNSTGSSPLSLE